MRPPQQTTLAVDPPFVQRLDNFVPGDNLEVLAGVQAALASSHFAGLWLCGSAGTGKTHLLRAACLAAHEQRGHAEFVSLSGMSRTTLLTQFEALDSEAGMIALDDVDIVCGDDDLEYALFSVYQRLVQEQGALLVSASGPATACQFNLPDLNSRMRGLLHYQLARLSDEHKAQLLRQRAEHKGYRLENAVLHYWLTHGPRDLKALLTDLERLDRASLARKRQVTIPLLKDELGY